jgi:hypothetical protein
MIIRAWHDVQGSAMFGKNAASRVQAGTSPFGVMA